MYKVLFSCIIIFYFGRESEQRAVRLEEKTAMNSGVNFPKQLNNSVDAKNTQLKPTMMLSTGNVHVKLAELAPNILKSPSSGLIDITLTGAPNPLFIEFSNDSKQIFGTAQTVCRQLGYSTYKSVEERNVLSSHPKRTPDQLPYCISPGNWGCSGNEQNLALCSWNEVKTHRCQYITYVTCGVCEDSFLANEGLIRSPGYPLVHLHDISCYWNVLVPSTHTIALRFHSAANFHYSDCTFDKAHVEITYRIQESTHFETYCNFPSNKDVRIPSNEVKIRFFSGIFSPNDSSTFNTEDQGLKISYAAISTSPFDIWRIIVFAVPIALFILGVIACCIFHKVYFRTTVHKNDHDFPPIPNMLPSKFDLNMEEYKFQHCKTLKEEEAMKGLRFRSPLSSIPSTRPPGPPSSRHNQVHGPACMSPHGSIPLNGSSLYGSTPRRVTVIEPTSLN